MAKIAIAGASGFVGKNLISHLKTVHSVRALGRSKPSSPESGVEWKETELFSASSTIEALKGIDVAIYLVHSMLPSSKLFQGNFHDTDLLLADNFSNACKENGVKQIIYLGGLVPE
ncbi:MAG: NAD(P)H-binding protein, partial [Pseudomonadota bacterium]